MGATYHRIEIKSPSIDMNHTAIRDTTPQPSQPAPETAPNALEQAAQLQQVLRLVKPVLDFHEAVADACDHDLRFYWDVRLVSGKATPFCHVRGTTTIPALFAPQRLLCAGEVIEAEVREKILIPLLGAIQDEQQRLSFERVAGRRLVAGVVTEEECFEKPSGNQHDNDNDNDNDNDCI